MRTYYMSFDTRFEVTSIIMDHNQAHTQQLKYLSMNNIIINTRSVLKTKQYVV